MHRTSIEWDNLYHELLSFVYSKVKDKIVAEDIVQDVFIKVHTKSHQVKESERITRWIFQITRNAIADHFRNSTKNLQPVDVDWETGYHELNDCVAHCLTILVHALPEKYRLPLVMTEIENLSQLDVAQRLNITYSGARSRVQRARKLLKEKLDELYMIRTDTYGNVIICENKGSCCCKKVC